MSDLFLAMKHLYIPKKWLIPLNFRAVICSVREKNVEQLIFSNNETRIISVRD